MKKIIPLHENKYIYSSIHNKIINSEFFDYFIKNDEYYRITPCEIELNKQTIINNIKLLPQIVLNITQDCNLLCRYCPYNLDLRNKRKRSSQKMDIEIAKNSILNIYELIKERINRNFIISFYGGEPLLEMNKIIEIVKFAELLFDGWDLEFHITTNGTLFTNKIINFFIKNNFHILISLDGPKEIHDKNRIYPNGSGSFNKVVQNLAEIKRKNLYYYKNNIRFSMVWARNLSILKIYQFVINNELIDDSKIRLSIVKENEYYDKYPLNRDLEKKEFNVVEKIALKKYLKNEKLNYIEQTCINRIDQIERYELNKNPSILLGTCFFNSRLFIETDGSFHICNSICNKFPIGSSKTGFNFTKMEKLMHSYVTIVKEHCLHCDIRFLCQSCIVTFTGDGMFKMDHDFCNYMKTVIKTRLNKLVEVKNIAYIKQQKNQYIFHQFIHIEKGNKGCIIIDFLKGNIYHTTIKILDDFFKQKYSDIPEFIETAKKEKLFANSNENWIPRIYFRKSSLDELKHYNLIVEIEENSPLSHLFNIIENFNVGLINYYGTNPPEIDKKKIKLRVFDADIDQCRLKQSINFFENKITEKRYRYNMNFNNCWGNKVALKSDYSLRPCIFSDIKVGNLNKENIFKLIRKLKFFWNITKDKISVCKECEFRYICRDCRVFRKNKKNIYSKSSLCNYDPIRGKWLNK
jgi:uncharacterized protein